METKTLRLISLDEGDVRESHDKPNLRLVCVIEGDGKLAVWGSPRSLDNIEKVKTTEMPCTVECECIPAPEPWASKFNHRYWVPEGRKLQILPK